MAQTFQNDGRGNQAQSLGPGPMSHASLMDNQVEVHNINYKNHMIPEGVEMFQH